MMIKRLLILWCAIGLNIALVGGSYGQTLTTVRVGSLQYGTVNWELAIIRKYALDRQYGVRLEVTPLANNNALSLALQSGAVDVVVGDWLWVNRQRHEGKRYQFFPYSLAIGGLYAAKDSSIHRVEDLRGQKLGIAGGEVDKNWLLLRSLLKKKGIDPAEHVNSVFAAPPMLNALLLRGQLPAVVSYWHYGARLLAAGHREVLPMNALIRSLGIEAPVPVLGWVFKQAWAQTAPLALQGFLRASYAAKKRLQQSNTLWEVDLLKWLKAKQPNVLGALRDGYRQGVVDTLTQNGYPAAQKLFATLAEEGGATLTGGAKTLDPDTFWQGTTVARIWKTLE